MSRCLVPVDSRKHGILAPQASPSDQHAWWGYSHLCCPLLNPESSRCECISDVPRPPSPNLLIVHFLLPLRGQVLLIQKKKNFYSNRAACHLKDGTARPYQGLHSVSGQGCPGASWGSWEETGASLAPPVTSNIRKCHSGSAGHWK